MSLSPLNKFADFARQMVRWRARRRCRLRRRPAGGLLALLSLIAVIAGLPAGSAGSASSFTIAKAHCKVGKLHRKASSGKKKDVVLAQSPRHTGKKLKHGARVNLTVGKGPKKK